MTAGVCGPSELNRLASAYPAFWFSREAIGRRGARWVARRKDGLRPGLHTVITADLAELRAALANPDDTAHGR